MNKIANRLYKKAYDSNTLRSYHRMIGIDIATLKRFHKDMAEYIEDDPENQKLTSSDIFSINRTMKECCEEILDIIKDIDTLTNNNRYDSDDYE